MTIRNIEIENLRGVREGKLDGMGQLTILTGPNGCGKSTVLDGIHIWAAEDVVAPVIEAATRRRTVPNGFSWLLPRGGNATCQLSVEGEHRTTAIRAEGAALQVQDSDGPRLQVPPVHTAKQTRATGVPTRLTDPGLPQDLTLAYSDAVRSGRKQLVIDLLTELTGARVDLEILAENDGRPALYIAQAGGAVPVGMSGDGVQAFLQIALNIASAPGGLVLIEEPETYQHPRAMRLTAQAIAAVVKRDVQVVLTTHSIEMVRALCEATDYSDETVLFNLALPDGKLRSSRHAGEELRTALEVVEADLR